MTAEIKENRSKHRETSWKVECCNLICFLYQKKVLDNKEEETSEQQITYLFTSVSFLKKTNKQKKRISASTQAEKNK